nr:RNA-directed DNA polymerase, eukaryota [Tanacetum cinerariifolium]
RLGSPLGTVVERVMSNVLNGVFIYSFRIGYAVTVEVSDLLRSVIKVDNIDRLVANLCTIWIGRFHLHANVARIHREHKPSAPSHPSNANERNSPGSYVSIFRSGKTNNVMSDLVLPSLILDDSCISGRDFSLSLMVTVKGLVYWVRAKEMEAWDPIICNDSYESESSDDDEDAEDDGPEIKSQQIMMLRGSLNQVRKDSGDDLKYPPDFTPSVINVEEVNKKVKGATSNEVNEHANSISNKLEESVPKEKLSSNNSVCSKRVHTGGSILQLMDALIKETKMKSMELVTIKTLWVNSSLDYAFSSSLGNSMGILCVWEPTLFVKDNVTSYDNFLAVMDRWEGDCVIMGDFNEVRTEKVRYGSVFNVQGANAFNSFIFLASLIDLPLDDYAYTWAHKTTNKMSKLDRFLVSKGLLASFPYLSAIGLDRNISDHHPILIRELSIHYGPVDSNAAQKSKVRWAIKGDENTKFFHVILNSKRSQLAIRGTLVDGESSLEQQADLDRNVSNEEIKSAVWDCGTNKSSGPDGFTFEFFRIPIDSSLTLSHIFFVDDDIFVEAAGEFSVKFVRQLIDDSILLNEEVATRWVKVMPIKINVFAWGVHLGKLPTRLNISLKGIYILTIVCPLCHAYVKSGSISSFPVQWLVIYEENLSVGGSSRTLI